VGRLRAYGNAIVSEVAATFIASVMDVLDARIPLAPVGSVSVESLIG
jgi:hypothetical protein